MSKYVCRHSTTFLTIRIVYFVISQQKKAGDCPFPLFAARIFTTQRTVFFHSKKLINAQKCTILTVRSNPAKPIPRYAIHGSTFTITSSAKKLADRNHRFYQVTFEELPEPPG